MYGIEAVVQGVGGAPSLEVAVAEVDSGGEGQAFEECVARNDFHACVRHVTHVGMTIVHRVDIEVGSHGGEKADVAYHVVVGAEIAGYG